MPTNGVVVSALLIAVSAVSAWSLVFGETPGSTGSLLAGRVLPTALAGGAAVAVSWGGLLVLGPVAAVTAGAVSGQVQVGGASRLGVGRGASFLVGFAGAFVVAISGVPAALAEPVYGAQHIIDLAGGLGLLVYGIVALAPGVWSPRRAARLPRWPRWIGPAAGALVGSASGLVLAHELDPLYDSVFFLTGNAVAASHAPLTVTMFMLGLGLVVLSLMTLALTLAGIRVVGTWVLCGLRIAGGAVTAIMGIAFLSGQFAAIRALVLS